MRIGLGFDMHQLTENRALILGGVQIPFEKGLLGHSDADVLIHAIMDAILGALNLGTIGDHFPDTDDKYKNISSLKLLQNVASLIKKNHYKIENIDSIIVAEKPKMAPFIPKMKDKISQALDIDPSQVSIKATTTEKLGPEGQGLGISAQAIVLLTQKQ